MIGQTVGHYRILEKIGAGGMGVVYRAHDEQLDRDVALKVLSAGTLADDVARRRFRKEALTLAKMNHPNIEIVYEFNSWNDLDFLAMELIPGTSLRETLKQGPLPEREVIRLGVQLAEGLSAAHGQGVVHRDLKPGNLIISPEGRLKILDFGLATLLRPGTDPDVTLSVTEATSGWGTLPYMSAEQLRGLPVDARTDIYSAGAVLYEMATGYRPFWQSQRAELIGAILHQTPGEPSTHNRRIGPAFESLIMKALDKDPARRYQSARELLVALEGLDTRLRTGSRPRFSRPLPTAAKVRPSVAVLGFKNVSGRSDLAWLSTALSEMLTTELAAGEQLRTIPGENVARVRISLSLPEADSFGKETLMRIRKNLSADSVVLGSYIPLGRDQIRLDLRLQDTLAGETLAAVYEKGSEARIDDLVRRAGTVLREKLGARGVSSPEAAAVKASFPSNSKAARLYSEGLAKLRIFDALGARGLLEKAIAADPNYALAHSALAGAWSALRYDKRARDEAKKAFDLSSSLSREDRLSVEGRYRETTQEWLKAEKIYRTLWDFFPDNLDYGLRLANAQTSAGKGKDALATLETLRSLPSPAKDDPQIDIAEARAARSLANLRREQEVAARAAATGRTIEARLLVAQARLLEGGALNALGEPEKARAAFEEARQTYAAAGDRAGVARARTNTAVLLWEQGDLAGAKAMYEEALSVFREVGNRFAVAAALNNIANVLEHQGDLQGARKMHEEALAIRREIGDKSGMAQSLLNIGSILTHAGDLDGAKKTLQESLVIGREIGDPSHISTALQNLAGVLADQGDLNGAKKTYKQVLAMKRDIGDRSGLAHTLNGLGGLLSELGDLREARKIHGEALAIQTQLGELGSAAQSELYLASLDIEEGCPANAEKRARKAIDEYEIEHAADAEALARVVLARSLLAQDLPGKAQETISRATALAGLSQAHTVRFSVGIISSRIRATLGRPAEARTALEATLAEAKENGFVRYQLEARLALGEIELKAANPTVGRAGLTALEKDAAAKGFHLIARRAADTNTLKGLRFRVTGTQ